MEQQVTAPVVYYDNTRVQSFFQCPRQFYFRHIRHWTKERKSAALAFGSGWHAMMEVIWALADQDVSNTDLLEAARVAFNDTWVKEGFELQPAVINLAELRNPGLAADMAAEYIAGYREQIRGFEVLAIEQPFAVPLFNADALYPGSPAVFYIGRWDKVYRDRHRIYVREHKTTSVYRKEGVFAPEFVKSFSPNSQIDGYSYSALGVYGESFKGVVVEGAMVHKSVRGFLPIPIQRTHQNLESWAYDVTYWINEISENMEILAGVGAERLAELPYLPAFPKRTEHCQHKYGMCGFLDICKYADANVSRISCPDGYSEEVWDPFTHNVEGEQQLMVVGSGGIQSLPPSAEPPYNPEESDHIPIDSEDG